MRKVDFTKQIQNLNPLCPTLESCSWIQADDLQRTYAELVRVWMCSLYIRNMIQPGEMHSNYESFQSYQRKKGPPANTLWRTDLFGNKLNFSIYYLTMIWGLHNRSTSPTPLLDMINLFEQIENTSSLPHILPGSLVLNQDNDPRTNLEELLNVGRRELREKGIAALSVRFNGKHQGRVAYFPKRVLMPPKIHILQNQLIVCLDKDTSKTIVPSECILNRSPLSSKAFKKGITNTLRKNPAILPNSESLIRFILNTPYEKESPKLSPRALEYSRQILSSRNLQSG